MGNFLYKSSPEELLSQINETGKAVIDNYGVFVDSAACDKLSVIYENELKSFRKQEINGVSVLLGLTVPSEKVDKTELCKRIVDHYNKRITLISTITSSLSFCNDRIKALNTGPRCTTKPDIFDKTQCPGNWVETITAPDADVSENSEWYRLVDEMVEKFGDSMVDLLAIVIRLRDFDESIDDDELNSMIDEAPVLIDEMHKVCFDNYQKALTTPTYSKAEIELLNEQQRIADSENSARVAALRNAHGLSAVPGK